MNDAPRIVLDKSLGGWRVWVNGEVVFTTTSEQIARYFAFSVEMHRYLRDILRAYVNGQGAVIAGSQLEKNAKELLIEVERRSQPGIGG